MNYTHRLATQALAAGDTAAYELFDEQTLICKKSLFVYQDAREAQKRGDHATFNSLSLELRALLARIAPLPTPDTPQPQRRSKAPRQGHDRSGVLKNCACRRP